MSEVNSNPLLAEAPPEPSRIIQLDRPAPVPLNWTMRCDGNIFVGEVTTGPLTTAFAMPVEAAGRFAVSIQDTITKAHQERVKAQAKMVGGPR